MYADWWQHGGGDAGAGADVKPWPPTRPAHGLREPAGSATPGRLGHAAARKNLPETAGQECLALFGQRFGDRTRRDATPLPETYPSHRSSHLSGKRPSPLPQACEFCHIGRPPPWFADRPIWLVAGCSAKLRAPPWPSSAGAHEDRPFRLRSYGSRSVVCCPRTGVIQAHSARGSMVTHTVTMSPGQGLGRRRLSFIVG